MPPNQAYRKSISGTLRLVAAAFGLACLLDTARQGFSGGTWLPFMGLYKAYYPVLSAYAASREWEKWTSKETRAEEFWGNLFIYAWGALALLLYFSAFFGFAIAWPPTFNGSLSWVFGIYAAGKGSTIIRNWTSSQDPGTGGAPDPGGSGSSGGFEAVRQMCQGLRRCSASELVQRTGLPLDEINGCLGRLVRNGLMEKRKDGLFYWIGP
ncbi:MAG: hypothetical protein ACYCPQ_05375 [Elusimicrobiota bacterium]